MFVCTRAQPRDVRAIDRLAQLSGLRVDAAAALDDDHVHTWVARAGPGPDILGFLIATRAGDDFELTDLGTAPAHRRCGVASALLEALIESARSLGLRQIFLEVRTSNAGARALYDNLGFHLVGERKNYYRDPVENALCLRLTVEPVAPRSHSNTP